MNHPDKAYMGLPQLDELVGRVKSLSCQEVIGHKLSYQLRLLQILDSLDVTVESTLTAHINNQLMLCGWPFNSTADVLVYDFLREQLPYWASSLLRDWVRLYNADDYDIVVDYRECRSTLGSV